MKKSMVAVAIVLLLVPVSVLAEVVSTDWSDSRTNTSGILANDGWNGGPPTGSNGFELSWNITQASNGLFTYTYTISGGDVNVLSKGLSHWILEGTDPSVLSDFGNLTVTGTYKSGSYTVSDPFLSGGLGTWTEQQGSPNLPSDIYGLKINLQIPNPSGGTSLVGLDTATISFTTYHQPVWGDFYAADGQYNPPGPEPQYRVTAWNTNFGTDPTITTTDFTGWITTPDSIVPEPGLCVLGFGALVAGVFARRQARKKTAS